MRVARRARAVHAACAVAFVLGTAGCTAEASGRPTGPADASAPAASATTTVVRADVTSVLVLSGTVRSQPTLAVRAGSGGPVDILAPEGAEVIAGAVIGTVGDVPVTSPASGVLRRWRVTGGAMVPADLPIADVGYRPFGSTHVPVEYAYRLYGVSQGQLRHRERHRRPRWAHVPGRRARLRRWQPC